jgi:hypothetical protein
MRRIAVFGLAIVAAACGLGVTGLAPEMGAPDGGGPTAPGLDSGPSPVVDSGSGADADASPVDAGQDGNVLQPNGQCQTIIDDSFDADSLDPRWRLAGAAIREPGGIVLTGAGVEYDVGGIWWSEPIPFGKSLTAVFSFQQFVAAGDNPGYAIGIGWVKDNAAFGLGDQGPNAALCNSGLTGVAATLRLGSTTRLDAIAGISGNCDTHGGFTDTFERGTGKLVLELTPGRVAARAEGKTDRYPDPIDFSQTGLIGFTAATGSNSTGTGRFTITQAQVEVCP